jgi:hypothetical protein
MEYDPKADYAEYMGGASDYANARTAKKLIDAKRAAKEQGGQGAHDADVLGEAGETPMDDGAPAADAAIESEEGAPVAGGEGGGKIPVEVTPEELAMLERMRAGQGA